MLAHIPGGFGLGRAGVHDIGNITLAPIGMYAAKTDERVFAV